MSPVKPPKSPLEAADDAKRNRDLAGEVEALMDGEKALTEASWYPPVAGDIVTVHYESTPATPTFTESYLVTETSKGVELVYTGCSSDDPDVEMMCGFFAGDLIDDPVMQIWMEAGPARMSVTRHGELVHDGPGSWQ